MTTPTVETTIARDPADVFAVLCDVSKNASWSSASVSGVQLTPGPVGLGTQARETSRLLGREIVVTSEVVDFVRNRRLAFETKARSFPFRGSFDLEPAGAGTRLSASFEGGPTGLLSWSRPIFMRLARRQYQRDLATLKNRMERGEL